VRRTWTPLYDRKNSNRGRSAMIRQPLPKPDVMARRGSIVAGLRALLPETGLIAEPLRL
jgi:hypothetical protein